MSKRYALVSNLFDVEESAFCAYVRFSKVFDSVDDGGANGQRDPVVIRLADTSNSGNVGTLKDILGSIYNKL